MTWLHVPNLPPYTCAPALEALAAVVVPLLEGKGVTS